MYEWSVFPGLTQRGLRQPTWWWAEKWPFYPSLLHHNTMHASFPSCYPHAIKYTAAWERICFTLVACHLLQCVFFFLATGYKLVSTWEIDFFFFSSYWTPALGEWVDNHNLTLGLHNRQETNPTKRNMLAAVRGWMVFRERSSVSENPLVSSWKNPSFDEWPSHCPLSQDYRSHCQLTQLICQTWKV